MIALAGECERAQIWGWDVTQARVNIRLDFSVLDLSINLATAPTPASSTATTAHTPGRVHLPATIWTWKQQGYVHTNGSRHYTCLENILLWNRSSAPAVNRSECANTPQFQCMSECPADPKGRCLGGNAPDGSCNMCDCNVQHTTCPPIDWSHLCLPGWYPDPLLDVPATGVPLVPAGFTQPMVVEACIPYGTVAGNYTGVISITHQVPAAGGAGAGKLVAQIPMRLEVWDIDLPRLNDSGAFNTAFRFDSDMRKWYPAGTAPAATWADWMPFLAHHRVPADDIYLLGPRPTAEYTELAATGAKWMAMMTVQDPPIPPGYVDHVIDTLAPTLANMTHLGLSDKMYVYGFDEMPESKANMQAVYQIFGGLKAKWPNITTMAVLDWETMPADLPLDIWVDEVDDYSTSLSFNEPTAKEKLRQAWLASSPTHQYWWYWCINPENPAALNTFVERPAIQGRLLFWLSALHAINGMLYYDVAIWSEQCPTQRPCKPVGRINGTALTDFNPGNSIAPLFQNGANTRHLRCVSQPAPSGDGRETCLESTMNQIKPVLFMIVTSSDVERKRALDRRGGGRQRRRFLHLPRPWWQTTGVDQALKYRRRHRGLGALQSAGHYH